MNIILDDDSLLPFPSKGVVLVGGCFDIIHAAHIKFLRLSKEQGKILVVLLESDANIRKLKGKNRPLNNQNTRAENLSKIEYVDYIILLKKPTSSDYYYNLVKLIQPDIIAVTSGDPLISVKKIQAEEVSGRVVEVMTRDKNHSSTLLIQ